MVCRGLLAHELAGLAGICTSTMTAALNGRPVSPRTLRKIAVALTKVPVVPGSSDLLDEDAA
jgi:hypothetical protein